MGVDKLFVNFINSLGKNFNQTVLEFFLQGRFQGVQHLFGDFHNHHLALGHNVGAPGEGADQGNLSKNGTSPQAGNGDIGERVFRYMDASFKNNEYGGIHFSFPDEKLMGLIFEKGFLIFGQLAFLFHFKIIEERNAVDESKYSLIFQRSPQDKLMVERIHDCTKNSLKIETIMIRKLFSSHTSFSGA